MSFLPSSSRSSRSNKENKIAAFRPAVLAFAFAAVAMVMAAPALPGAFAHGGHQPPAADFNGKKASIFVKLEPSIVTSTTDPVLITARFFDENTNENFKHVTYRIFFKKDGQEIPIQSIGGEFGGQGFFYDPEGNVRIKVIPKETTAAVAKGDAEPQFGGIWNRGEPIVVEGPIFNQAGLYNLFVEIHTAGTTRTQVAPVLQYDVWVTPGREETIDVVASSSDGSGTTQQVKVRNYYGAIDKSSYDPETNTIQFSMPFDWTSDMPKRIGMLHTEVFIPKALSDFDRESLNGTVNGIGVPVFVDTFGSESTVVHFTISKQNLENIASQIASENRTPDEAVFALSPPAPENEVKVMQTSADSQNYRVSISWPESIFPENPVTFGVRIADKDGKPVPAATYELVIADKDGGEVTRAGGVTTPEGISSQDVRFASQGSFTVRVDKINASGESVQTSVQVVPEFPVGIALVAAAAGIMSAIILARRKGAFLSASSL